MAPAMKLRRGFVWAIVILLCFLTYAILPSKSVGGLSSHVGRKNNDNEEISHIREMEMVLGSRPPKCKNRCKNCRPCMAVLVIPPYRKTIKSRQEALSSPVLTANEEENYYLLSWKCRCKGKLFKP